MLRTEIDSMPAELDELTRRVMRLEIEEAALDKETTRPAKPAWRTYAGSWPTCAVEADAMRAQWEAERQALRKVQELREEIERVRREAEQAERNYDLNRAAELRHGRYPNWSDASRPKRPSWPPSRAARRLLREVVTEEEIAIIVSRWTGIPVAVCRRASGTSCCASIRFCTSG